MPVTPEPGDQHIHVQWSEAVAPWAPGADAMVGIDKVAKSFGCVAGYPSRVRMRESYDKYGSAVALKVQSATSRK